MAADVRVVHLSAHYGGLQDILQAPKNGHRDDLQGDFSSLLLSSPFSEQTPILLPW